MGATVRFTALYGARSESRAHAYLLRVDDFTFLLDCGWHPSLDPAEAEAALRPVLPSVDAVLLTHAHLTHCAALPAAAARWGLRKDTPVYSTLPVWRMGQMFLYDAYQTAVAAHPFEMFDLDDVDAAFEVRGPAVRFRLLKFHQSCPMPGAPKLVITPHRAGHTLGGAVWSIQKDADHIVYALDLNHRREHHLDPTTLRSFPRPSHLVLGAAGAPTRTRPLRQHQLLDPILAAVRKGGDVLVPVDTAARVIELAVELNNAWSGRPRNDPLARVPLLVAHEFAGRTLDFARTMIEFMSEDVVKRFDTTRENLFDFKHLRACPNRAAVDALPSPKVVLAAPADLDAGLSQSLLLDWAPRPECTVILVGRPEPNTLAALLATHAEDGGGGPASAVADSAAVGAVKGRVQHKPFSLPVTVRRRQELSGEALDLWRKERAAEAAREQERAREEVEAATAAKEAASRAAVESAVAKNLADAAAARAVADADAAAAAAQAASYAKASAAATVTHAGGGDSSSSDDDDDDGDYDMDMVMGVSTAARSGGRSQLLTARQQRSSAVPSNSGTGRMHVASAGIPIARGAQPGVGSGRSGVIGYGVGAGVGVGAGSGSSSIGQGGAASFGKGIDGSGIHSIGSSSAGGVAGAGPGGGQTSTLALSSARAGFAAGRGSGFGLVGSSPSPAGQAMMMGLGRGMPMTAHVRAPGGATGGEKGSWDDYGQAVGLNRFAIGEDPDESLHASRLGLRPGGGAPTGADAAASLPPAGSIGEARDLGRVEDIPLEYTSRKLDLQVACRVVAVDRSGLSEGDALKHLVKELEPRRVILVNGTDEETDHLEHYLSSALSASLQSQLGSSGTVSSSERLRAKFRSLNDQKKLAVGRVSSAGPFPGDTPLNESGLAVRKAHMNVERGKRRKTEDGVSCDLVAPLAVIVAPSAGEDVDITSHTSVQNLQLGKDVVDNLQWNRLGLSSIAYLEGALVLPGEGCTGDAVVVGTRSSQNGNDLTSDGMKDEELASRGFAVEGAAPAGESGSDEKVVTGDSVGGVFDAMDASVIPADACKDLLTLPTAHPTVFVGTIMLSRLKDVMARAGIRAELAEGILCVQNRETGAVVLIKKVGVQNLVIEGALSEEYYAVRDVLYKELVVVSAGPPY